MQIGHGGAERKARGDQQRDEPMECDGGAGVGAAVPHGVLLSSDSWRSPTGMVVAGAIMVKARPRNDSSYWKSYNPAASPNAMQP